MSLTIFIGEDITWMPTSGKLETILFPVAENANKINTTVAETLWKMETSSQLDIKSFNQIQFNNFFKATEITFINITRGIYPNSFLEEDYFPFELKYFSELKSVLHFDKRLNSQGKSQGVIELNEDYIWSGPYWLYDLLLEIFATNVRIEHKNLSDYLFAGCSWNGKLKITLADVSPQQYIQFLKAVEWMVQRWFSKGVYDIACERFYTNLNEYLQDFILKFLEDVRVK